MATASPQQPPMKNWILASLPPAEYARLSPNLKLVPLKAGNILCEAGDNMEYAYFINHGIASLISAPE